MFEIVDEAARFLRSDTLTGFADEGASFAPMRQQLCAVALYCYLLLMFTSGFTPFTMLNASGRALMGITFEASGF